MNMKQPEYVYIGRLPCNCCVGVVNDDLYIVIDNYHGYLIQKVC